MKMMTQGEARDTRCPLKMAGAAGVPPANTRPRTTCDGGECQLFVTSPEDETRGRCSFAFGAMTLFQVPAAIGDSVFNALANLRAQG